MWNIIRRTVHSRQPDGLNCKFVGINLIYQSVCKATTCTDRDYPHFFAMWIRCCCYNSEWGVHNSKLPLTKTLSSSHLCMEIKPSAAAYPSYCYCSDMYLDLFVMINLEQRRN